MFKPNTLPSRTKLAVTLVLLVSLVLVSLGSATVMHNQTTIDAEVDIVSWSDPTDVHRMTQMQVQVTNTGPEVLTPAFSMTHGGLATHNYWQVIDGPDRLHPEQTATYTIRAPVPQFGVPFGVEYVLGVNDRGTETRTKRTFDGETATSLPTILNPTFDHWQINPGESGFRPYRWSRATSEEGAREVTIEEQNGSAHLYVESQPREAGPWSMGGVQQQASFPETIHIEATPGTVLDEPTRHPPSAAGVEIGENNHRVWIVFADVSEKTVVYRPGKLSYILVFVPAQAGERVETTVDVDSLYDKYDWERPEKVNRTVDHESYTSRPVNILAFAADYPSNESRIVDVIFHEIRANSSQEL